MARKGRNFELDYEWLYSLNKNKYKVTSPAMLYDKTTTGRREIDVLVEYFDDNGLNRKIGIECRDRKNIVDSMWIEQLTTKKEDLELDCIIATTTKDFTNGAIKKAAAHGVIIERAERVDKNTVEKISENIYLDMYFLKFEFIKLIFKRNNKIYNYKDLINELSFVEQNELISELKGPLYYSLDPHKIFDTCGFHMDDFYKNEKNSITFKSNFNSSSKLPGVFKKLNIEFIYYEILATPLKITYPVNRQISIFKVETKQNKKFKVRYGSDEEYFECGYIDDGIIHINLKLKERKYYRYIGMNMCVNTIFPDGYKIIEDENMLNAKMFGEISFEKII